MELKDLVKKWFETWENGNFYNLPITDNFTHSSPYGTVSGKALYLSIVKDNQDKFLGHKFTILDELYEEDRACVRYIAIKGDFNLEVSEWYYKDKNGSIKEIIAYYNIEGKISEERILSIPD